MCIFQTCCISVFIEDGDPTLQATKTIISVKQSGIHAWNSYEQMAKSLD